MATNDSIAKQYMELSPVDLRAQLAVLEKSLINSRLSLSSGKMRSSVLNQRRQIARLLTQLRVIEH